LLRRKIIDMYYTACISKNYGHTLPADFTVFAFFRSWFTWNPLFLRLGCEVMDPCFVHSNRCNESTQKFIWTLHWNISKHCFKIVTRSCLWSTVSKCSSPILPIAFSYSIVHAKLKSLCHVICLWPSQQARALVDQLKQYCGLYRCSLNWTSQMRCITYGCMTMFKFIHPIIYNHKRWYKYAQH